MVTNDILSIHCNRLNHLTHRIIELGFCRSEFYNLSPEDMSIFKRFIRDRGMSYAEVEERGIYLPVREAACRYRTPARFDDELWVRCGVSEWRRASLLFAYEVYKADRTEIVATGMTEHACVNKDGRPVRVPDWLKGLFG